MIESPKTKLRRERDEQEFKNWREIIAAKKRGIKLQPKKPRADTVAPRPFLNKEAEIAALRALPPEERRLSFNKERLAYLLLTPEQIAKKKERRRQRYAGFSNEDRERELKKHKQYRDRRRDRDPEGFRAKETARRLKNRRENLERDRAQFRDWYERNKERARAKIYATRNANDPIRGLAYALSQYRSGAIGIDELDRRYDQLVKRADEIARKARQAK